MSHVGNHRRCRQPGRKGTTSVEMALAAPILLTLVFGIMQIGYAYMAQHMVENAALKGCRTAILPSRSQSAVTSSINDVLQPLGLSNSSSTTIKVNNVQADVSSATSGDSISVQVSVNLSAVTFFPSVLGSRTGTLTNTVAMRCQ